ncbi:Arginyl-tRNA--protein transferase 1 [Anopheles sinensis]|uniref:Arginyl-tRNA--protein transferase 1 n=1 Tax=Anopheles sinensis TaxID=74873 RepID=A0A084WJT5_ANOSI|nr:Arginyl-tRNA--protein transferase 1 [Anopheles sinensis]
MHFLARFGLPVPFIALVCRIDPRTEDLAADFKPTEGGRRTGEGLEKPETGRTLWHCTFELTTTVGQPSPVSGEAAIDAIGTDLTAPTRAIRQKRTEREEMKIRRTTGVGDVSGFELLRFFGVRSASSSRPAVRESVAPRGRMMRIELKFVADG